MTHHLPLENCLREISKVYGNERMFQNFKKCLQSFGYTAADDNVIEFFEMIVVDPQRFKNKSNFPKTWISDNSFAAGVASISKAIDCDVVKNCFEPEHFQKIKSSLLEYLHELKGTSVSVSKTAESQNQSQTTSNKKTFVEVIKEDAPSSTSRLLDEENENENKNDNDNEEDKVSDSSSFDDTGDYMLRLLEESHNMLTDKNSALQILYEENRILKGEVHNLKTQVEELNKLVSVSDVSRLVQLLRRKLDVCISYIKSSADKDPPLVDAFMQLLLSDV